MPRKIRDESGQEIEVFDQSDVEAAAEAAKKEAQAIFDTKQKELEQELNPNWKAAREKMAVLEREKQDYAEKLAKAGIKSEQPVTSPEEIARIASEAASKTYIDRYKDEVLGAFGDKRAVVEKYFEKLSAGEALDRSKIDEIAKASAGLAGVTQSRDNHLAAISAGGGSMPNFPSGNNGNDFATSPEGKATAEALGLSIDLPKA